MKYFLTISLLLIAFVGASFSAHAEEKAAVCRVLVQHKPADDVAYKAGVDVHGKAVAPADLYSGYDAAPFQVPDVINVPLEVDLAKRIASLSGKNIKLDAQMGMIEIYSNGDIRYNGQDVTGPVMTLCGVSHQIDEPVKIIPKKTRPKVKKVKRPVKKVPPRPAKPKIEPKAVPKPVIEPVVVTPTVEDIVEPEVKTEVKPEVKDKPIPDAKAVAEAVAIAKKNAKVKAELQSELERILTRESAVQDRQPEPNPIKSFATKVIETQAKEVETPQDVPVRIITNKPELIEGGEYR